MREEDFLNEILNMAADIGISDPRIEQALKDDPFKIDPLQAAEIITGKNAYTDDQTSKLGFCIMQAQSRAKIELLSKNDDSPFTCSIEEYRRIIESIGFIEISKYCDEYQGTREYQYFCWLDGMLMVWDTFHGNRNSSTVYAFIKRRDSDLRYPDFPCTHGPWTDGISHINFDAREAVRKCVDSLRDDFEILQKWPKVPFLWFNAIWERNEDSEQIIKQKINQFPNYVKKAIGELS